MEYSNRSWNQSDGYLRSLTNGPSEILRRQQIIQGKDVSRQRGFPHVHFSLLLFDIILNQWRLQDLTRSRQFGWNSL